MIKGLIYIIYSVFIVIALGASQVFANQTKNKSHSRKVSSYAEMQKLSPAQQKFKEIKAKKFMNESSAYKRLNTKKMKAVIFPEKVEMNEMKPEDYVKFLPRDLQDSSSEAYVANRFGDVALQKLLDSPQVRNSPMGRTATKVESAMKTEVSLNGPSVKGKGVASGAPRTEHKLSFQVMALQAQTKLEYKGWTNATVKHDARAKETGVEISEKFWRNKDLVLSHTKNDSEDKSALGVRWNW